MLQTRSPSRWFAQRQLLCGLVLLGLLFQGACQKKKSRQPLARSADWYGLKLGMTQPQATARMTALGWSLRCSDATHVMYLHQGAIYTRWTKKAAQGRILRCLGRLAKGVSTDSHQVRTKKLVFLDNKLIAMNIVISSTDAELGPILTKRFGVFRRREFAMHLYGSQKKGRMKPFYQQRENAAILWIRRAKMQELVFLDVEGKVPQTIQALVSTRKGE